MKKTFLLTFATLLLCVCMVLVLTACGGFTQDDIDNAVNDATASLGDKIGSLEGQIAELNAQIETINDEKDTLEADKAKLETDKAALTAELAKKEIKLACLKGEHVWDGESEIEYIWSGDLSKCTVVFDCAHCDEKGSAESVSTNVDEDGTLVAEFDGGFPSGIYVAPFVTGVTFNTDSEGYNEDTNTFLVSEENSFVITFTGENFDMLNEDKDFAVGIKLGDNWGFFDEIYDPVYDGVSITIEKDKITYIWDYDFTSRVLNGYGINQVDGFILCDSNTLEMFIPSMVEVNLMILQPDTPTDEWVTVTTAEELRAAVSAGGKIRFGADIESEIGYDLHNDTIIDLAGYDLKVTGDYQCTFWSYANFEVTDTVGGSILYNLVSVNGGTLKFSGAIQFEYSEYAINGSGILDLSEYTGDELYIYAEYFGGLILPDGYALYDGDGELIPDLDVANIVYVYVRPNGGSATDE